MDPYFDFAHGVLFNKLGIVESNEFEEVERDLAVIRDANLKVELLPGQYDLAHLCEFHRVIFEDIYPWAGNIRTVDISIDATRFCLSQYIESEADSIFRDIQNVTDLPRGLEETAEIIATNLGEVNALHPFREGNGRAQRAFFWQFARERGWLIDWHNADAEQNARVSAMAMTKNYKPMIQMIEGLLRPTMNREEYLSF